MSQGSVCDGLKNMHGICEIYANEPLYRLFTSSSRPVTRPDANEYAATVGVAGYKIVSFRMYVFAILHVLRLVFC